MTDRVAVPSIAGYIYQFDYSILLLLQLRNASDSIYVERIEDVDVESATEVTAVQCKYYAGTEYNHSVIAEPIRHMVSHFSANRSAPALNYKFYGHFKSGTEKLVLPLTVERLKSSLLTYTREKVAYNLQESLGLSDLDLEKFLARFDINVKASDIDAQREAILRLLQKEFECAEYEAEHYYYNNALAAIAAAAVQTNESERRITREDFIRKINCRSVLYNLWYVRFKTRAEFLKRIRKQFFVVPFNSSPFERFFLIDCATNPSDAELKTLLLSVGNKWSKLSAREPQPFCPYIYLHNYCPKKLAQLKTVLRDEDMRPIDGYDFKDAPFSAGSLTKTPTAANGIKIKVVNTLDELSLALSAIASTIEIFELYKGQPIYQPESTYIRKVSVEIQHFNDVKELLQ